jgi:hypothetical protein
MKQAGVRCVDCHIDGDKVIKPDTKICEKCHKPDYSSMANDWKTDIKKLIAENEQLISDAKDKNLTDEQKKLIDETKRFITQLNQYQSIYVHNYDLLSTILTSEKKKLKDIK